jgi:hypothetical protein
MSSNLEEEMRKQRHDRGSNSRNSHSKYSRITSMVRPVLKGIELFSPLTSFIGQKAQVFNVASGILEKLI